MSNYNIDFAPENLSTFNTLLKYGKIEFWLFIQEHTNTRRKSHKLRLLEKIEIFIKKMRCRAIFFIDNNKKGY